MKIFKHILNLFFSKKEKSLFAKGGTIPESEYKFKSRIDSNNLKDEILTKHSLVLKEDDSIPSGDDFFNPIKKENDSIPSGDDFFVSKKIIEKENKTDKYILNSENKPKKKRSKNVIGLKTKQDIKEHFQQYGFLDTLTCQQKFKVKSLRNFIWHLRKDGFVFKTERILLDNEVGEKVDVINYKLISKK
jgi:hypothetical protein